jgi:hypothetical protein
VLGSIRLDPRERILIPVVGWCCAHSVTLLRLITVVVVIAITAYGGFVCHGRIGPPG